MAKGDTAKKIIGGLMIAGGVATGNPMLAMQGAGTMAGGFAGNGKQGSPVGGGGAPAAVAPPAGPTPGSGIPVWVDSAVAKPGGVWKVPGTNTTIRTN